ncbi:hypothetical protein NDN08_000023 [Rhodosorus marinus]|uniref:PPM-type phosphatase domain-containing protein n=1 Tax=Rhodosorus marinus TaxID=101924 RepID=A0AAV8UHD6_9RHOD|nr:hypothetical protein NDN08_000023 [Rhodosorus marinus]
MAASVAFGKEFYYQESDPRVIEPNIGELHFEDREEAEEFCLECGIAEYEGRRNYMEDRTAWMISRLGFGGPQLGIFCVFDGHGGEMAAEYCKKNFVNSLMDHPKLHTDVPAALREIVKTTDDKILGLSETEKNYAGTTLNSVVVVGNKLYCCNVGDSRAVMSRDGMALGLSQDHSALSPAEVRRVRDAGGFVTSRGVNGVITLSRALGDLDLKGHKERTFPGKKFSADLIISEPDIVEFDVEERDEFVIIATDGLWAKMSNETAVKITKKSLSMYADSERAAKILVKSAYDAGSTDNISAAVVLLQEMEGTRTAKGMYSTHFFSNLRTANISSHGGKLDLTRTHSPVAGSPDLLEGLRTESAGVAEREVLFGSPITTTSASLTEMEKPASAAPLTNNGSDESWHGSNDGSEDPNPVRRHIMSEGTRSKLKASTRSEHSNSGGFLHRVRMFSPRRLGEASGSSSPRSESESSSSSPGVNSPRGFFGRKSNPNKSQRLVM